MMKVYLHQQAEPQAAHGIGRVVNAMYERLPSFVQLVPSHEEADVIATHVQGLDLPRIDALHLHGLYWTGDGSTYSGWHHDQNRAITASMVKAMTISVPSPWVAVPLKRDMRISPHVIGHGIDVVEWGREKDDGYVLWNKNRTGDVCDPSAAIELARRGVPVVTTYGPPAKNLEVTGLLPFAAMKDRVQRARYYLATTQETFGIGTLEALASGVPVIGYRHGGTADIVTPDCGLLVDVGDVDGLYRAIATIDAHYDVYSFNARARAMEYDWSNVIPLYVKMYEDAITKREIRRNGRVSVVITNYNYAQWLPAAIASARQPAIDEIIVVDDGSTDDSLTAIADEADITLIAQENAGVAAARNAGIAAATGEYVICLDADDRVGDVGQLADALRTDDALGIAYGKLRVETVNGSYLPNWPPAESTFALHATVGVPPANGVPSAAMFRRELWERTGGYQQAYAPGEDAEFWLKILSLGVKARRVTEEITQFYRLHGGSASRTKVYTDITRWHPYVRNPKLTPLAAQLDGRATFVRSYEDAHTTIIIPVGPGHIRYLQTAVESVLAQTDHRWRITVVNDSGQRLPARFFASYPFVDCVETPGGLGAGAARNRGLATVTTPYVLFLDADDLLLPPALGAMYHAAEESGRYIYSDWYAVGATVDLHRTADYDQLASLRSPLHPVSSLVRTEWVREVGGFDETLKGWEDWDFYAKLAVAGYCGERIALPLLYYRVASGQRRAYSMAAQQQLRAIFDQRYGQYLKGGHIMGCCGSNTPNTKTAVVSQPTGDTVRLEYRGDAKGSRGATVNKRKYRYGNNAATRFVDAHPDDVDILMRDYHFVRVVAVSDPAVVIPELLEAPVLVADPEPESRSVEPVVIESDAQDQLFAEPAPKKRAAKK